METLKSKLVQAPVLVYPDFSKRFILETDACIEGLFGAVLSQMQVFFLNFFKIFFIHLYVAICIQ